MFFSHKRSSKSKAVLFVVGSTRVTGALISLDRKEKPIVHYVHIEKIPPALQFDPEQFTKAVLSALMQCAMVVQSEGLHKVSEQQKESFRPDEFVLSFLAPWYLAQVQVLTVTLEKERPITHKTFKTLIADEIPHAIERAKKASTMLLGGVESVEQSVIQTKLNGYVSHNPIGKIAKELELTLYLSFVDSTVKKQSLDIVEKLFRPKETRIHTGQLSTHLGIRDLFECDHDALIVELLGEITAISIMSDNVLLDCATFPVGSNHILRSVAKRSGFSLETVQSQVALLIQGKLSESAPTTKRLADALLSVERIWVDSLETTLLALSSGAPIAKTAFCTADSAWYPWLSKVLGTYSSRAPGFSERNMSIIQLDKAHIGDRVVFSADTIFCPNIALEALRTQKETVDNAFEEE